MNTTGTGNYKVLEATNKLQDVLIKWKTELMSLGLTEYKKNGTDFQIMKRLRILEKLCKEGADLQYLEKERGFALIPQVFWSEELIQFFVDRGIDINSKDENGDSVLHLAIRHGLFDSSISSWRSNQDYFKERNPNYDPVNLIKFIFSLDNAVAGATNLLGETPIFTLAQAEWLKSNKGLREMWKVAQMLLKRAEVEALNADCESVLHLSPKNDSFIGVFKGDINVRSSSWLYSKTPLMEAARSNNLKCCRLLLQKGADLHVRDFQGYTALHHAVVKGANKCAEFLVKMGGADPNEKSAFRRDSYDLGIYRSIQIYEKYHKKVFTCNFTAPAKRAEILELAGAMQMIVGIIWNKGIYGFEMWNKLMKLCIRFKLQPSQQFLANYEFCKQNLNNFNSQGIIFQSAIDTVTRLTEGNTLSRFWHLLSFASTIEMLLTSDELQTTYVFKILNQVFWQDEQRVEDFVSMEEIDFRSLLGLVEFFTGWLKILVASGTKNEATPVRISQIHSIAHLIVACLNRTMNETKCKKVAATLMKLYVRLCYTLILLHSKFGDVISHHDNKRLLRTLVELDPRDRYGDSLVHNILQDCFYEGELEEEIFNLLDFVNIKQKNERGFEPVQSIYWQEEEDDGPDGDPKWFEVAIKLADMGVHVDARNANGGPTLRDMFKLKNSSLAFKYDSLKCACSRVLVRSLVPYRSLQKQNRLPKSVVDFIDSHLQF